MPAAILIIIAALPLLTEIVKFIGQERSGAKKSKPRRETRRSRRKDS
jgi:hypothetical protein